VSYVKSISMWCIYKGIITPSVHLFKGFKEFKEYVLDVNESLFFNYPMLFVLKQHIWVNVWAFNFKAKIILFLIYI